MQKKKKKKTGIISEWGLFQDRFGDHFGVGIISGSIWGSFRGRDHFEGCAPRPVFSLIPPRKGVKIQVTRVCVNWYQTIKENAHSTTLSHLFLAFTAVVQQKMTN